MRRHLHCVLVVDDHAAKRYSLARSLRAAGYRTMEAGSGSETLELAEQVSAVVLDIHLPDLLGFEVCRLLRQRATTADLPIVHVTNVFRSNADQAASALAGADAYYETPFDLDPLVIKIDSLIQARLARRRLAEPHPGFRTT